MPLDITVFILEGTAADLEGPEAHTRSYLAELAGIIGRPDKNMMSDLYDIVDILESNNSATLRFAFGRWQRGKEVLQNLHNSLANWRGETLQEVTSVTIDVSRNKFGPKMSRSRSHVPESGKSPQTQSSLQFKKYQTLPGSDIPDILCHCARTVTVA